MRNYWLWDNNHRRRLEVTKPPALRERERPAVSQKGKKGKKSDCCGPPGEKLDCVTSSDASSRPRIPFRVGKHVPENPRMASKRSTLPKSNFDFCIRRACQEQIDGSDLTILIINLPCSSEANPSQSDGLRQSLSGIFSPRRTA